MTFEVTIERAQLSLTDLVIPAIPAAPGTAALWLPEEGVDRPLFAYRLTYPGDSAYIDGRRPLAAALGDGVLNLVVYARGTDAATLTAQKDLLTAALSQWAFDITVTIGGVAETYEAWPTRPAWGQADSGMAGAFLDKATAAIPVNPPGA
jgi:hypothetical protein